MVFFFVFSHLGLIFAGCITILIDANWRNTMASISANFHYNNVILGLFCVKEIQPLKSYIYQFLLDKLAINRKVHIYNMIILRIIFDFPFINYWIFTISH